MTRSRVPSVPQAFADTDGGSVAGHGPRVGAARVIDVSDPASPEEVAYFVPPAAQNPVKPPQRGVLSQTPQVWGVVVDPETGLGTPTEQIIFAAMIAEVEVDTRTGQVDVLRSVLVHDVGKAINPRLAEGQIEGGSAQGLGYALLEDAVMRDGRMVNSQLTNYIIPTTLDTPRLDVTILENPYLRGPLGAKGVGEMPIDGPAPAVINALRHAGVDLREIPATPEKIMAACGSR